MANVYKVLGQSAPSATTATALYTVGAGKSAIVSTLQICNRATAARTFRIAVRPGGAALANQHYQYFDASIDANASVSITIGMTLAATDVLEVYASTNELSFTAYGNEIT